MSEWRYDILVKVDQYLQEGSDFSIGIENTTHVQFLIGFYLCCCNEKIPRQKCASANEEENQINEMTPEIRLIE